VPADGHIPCAACCLRSVCSILLCGATQREIIDVSSCGSIRCPQSQRCTAGLSCCMDWTITLQCAMDVVGVPDGLHRGLRLGCIDIPLAPARSSPLLPLFAFVLNVWLDVVCGVPRCLVVSVRLALWCSMRKMKVSVSQVNRQILRQDFTCFVLTCSVSNCYFSLPVRFVLKATYIKLYRQR
jgi:hypothetical protein